jgi:hypothetical protein
MAQGLSDRPMALDTVITHYRRRKMGAGVEQRRAAWMQRMPCTAVPGVFEMITDPPGAYTEIRDGKARILATIARHGYKP